MAQTSRKLSSQQRLRVFDAYRGRGHRTNSLWLVYSVKTDRDWILTSDRQLVHWIVFLEVCPNVRTFDMEIARGGGKKDIGRVAVETISHDAEVHHIFAGGNDSTSRENSKDVYLPSSDGTSEVRIFTDTELKPVVPLAMRWLKALAFAAVIREMELTALHTELFFIIESKRSGTVAEIFFSLPDFERPLIIGVLVRLVVQQVIEIDLKTGPLSCATMWHLPIIHG